MTVKELYQTARALMFDNLNSTNLDQYLLAHVNVLIAELFHDNNQLRDSKNKANLYTIPIVKSKDDVLIYEDELLYNVMPKGLAARFMQDEDDRSRYTMMQTEYMNARANVMPAVFEGWNA